MSTEEDMFEAQPFDEDDDGWHISPEEAERIRESWEAFKNCDHDWQPTTGEDRILAETCTKCGGGQGLLPLD